MSYYRACSDRYCDGAILKPSLAGMLAGEEDCPVCYKPIAIDEDMLELYIQNLQTRSTRLEKLMSRLFIQNE